MPLHVLFQKELLSHHEDSTGFLFQKLQDDALQIGKDGNGTMVHWGQFNSINSVQVEETCPNLDKWRKALSKLTQNGEVNSFSTSFTKEKRLELKAEININKTCLPLGRLRIDVSGRGFTSNSNVQIQSVPRDLNSVPPELVATVIADSSGKFQSSFTAFDVGPNAAILLIAKDDTGITAQRTYEGGCT